MHKSTLSISSLKAVSKYSNGVYRDNKKKGCRFSIGPNDAFKEWNTGWFVSSLKDINSIPLSDHV
jgi:hypothetical protein